MTYKFIEEGRVKFMAHDPAEYRTSVKEYVPSRARVFYNPLMKIDRDLMVAILRTMGAIRRRDLVMGEPMSGVGVRSIRALLETEAVGFSYMNDMNKDAFELMRKNVELNGISNRTLISNAEARKFLMDHLYDGERFDYVDLDPFGSPAPYFEWAITAVKHAGLLGVSATDTAVLYGIYPWKMMMRYGSFFKRVPFMKEVGIRVLIASMVITAAKHEIGVSPLVCYSVRHYVRGYFTIMRSRSKALKALNDVGYLIFSRHHSKWRSLRISRLSKEIEEFQNEDMRIYGPLWIGRYIDQEFLRFLKTIGSGVSAEVDELIGTLSTEASEIVGYYPNWLFRGHFGGKPPSPGRLIDIAKRHGIRASITHLDSSAIKLESTAEDFVRILG